MLNANADKVTPVRISPRKGFDLIPASEYSLRQLTDIYNQGRVDYVVPMPMNQAKLREYIANYDVDLEKSVVAQAGREPLGLAMLGIRGSRTWITRLGVIPSGRKRGVGRAMMNRLIDNARLVGARQVYLEVIRNNDPAQRLFESLGFKALRELHIIRRPPKPVKIITHGIFVEMLGYQEALDLLASRSDCPTWVTANQSLYNAGNLSALCADMPEGGQGWLVYQNTVFQLTRLVLQTETGDPEEIGTALLQNLHWRHPVQDTIVENVADDDPHLPIYKSLDYITSFSRIEMKLDLASDQ